VADFSGIADAPLAFHSDGRDVPNFRYEGEYASLDALDAPQAAGNFAEVAHGGAPTAQNALTGREWIEADVGFDWFERVHLTPRRKTDFGLVVTTVTATYELFNAHRKTVSTFSAFVNNAGAGVTVPELPTPPASLNPLTSFLDLDTTRIINLGPPPGALKLVVSVGPDGPPTFDDTLDFTFGPGGLLMLPIAGQRIALVSPRYESPVRETMGFLTEVIEGIDGREQRIALRKNPRQVLDVTYLLDLTERQRLQALLFGWQSNAFAVPVWHEELATSAAAAATATSVTVPSTANVDFRVGGLGVVIESGTKFDVIVISAITSTTITFTTTPLVNSYPAGTPVVPVRTAFLAQVVSGSRYQNNLEEFQASFEVIDNDTGAMVGSTAGWNTHDGKVLLDDCNVVDGPMTFELFQRISRIDNSTGVVTQSSRWSTNKRSSQKGFGTHGRAETTKLKKLLIALGGRQKSFYLPTFISDLTVSATLNSGSPLMDVDHVGYVRFVQDREHKKTFRISYNDGSPSEVKTILSSVQLTATTERLTLTTNWGASHAATAVSRVEFYELSRLDADELVLAFDHAGAAQLRVPVKVVIA